MCRDRRSRVGVVYSWLIIFAVLTTRTALGQSPDIATPTGVAPLSWVELRAALLAPEGRLPATMSASRFVAPRVFAAGSSSMVVDRRRSIGAAFGLSIAVPGLGQAYNRQWGKAIAAFALEAAVITGAIVWRRQGNQLESDYQTYAHTFWSPPKYAGWLNDYSVYITDNFEANVTASAIVVPQGIDFQHPEAWSDAQWQEVLFFFDQIQAMERQMFHVETRAAFSHTLPDFSEQQYYELIGKYYQFAPGWEDYQAWIDENGEYTLFIDPSRTGTDGSRPSVSDRFFLYAKDHAHANDVLRRASRVTALLLVTHFVAAVEAAVSAKLHNDRLTPGMSLNATPDGRVHPMASLRVRL